MFYIKSPFKPSPQLLVQGTPEYVFGKMNSDVSATQGFILKDSGNGTTGTYVIQIQNGNVPTVDSLLTVIGTANAAGAYNVTNVGVLSVSAAATPDIGIYTITALSAGNSAVASDYGQFIITVPEIGDALTTAGGASFPVCSPISGPNSIGKSISVTVTLPANTTANPSTLSAVTVVIQGANRDIDAEYSTIGTITGAGAQGNTYEWQSGQAVGAAAPGSVSSGSVNEINFRFYRLNVTGATGSGPIIGKIVQ